MSDVVNNYWKISEKQRKNNDGRIIQRHQSHQIKGIEPKKKFNYWYLFLNAFVHICIVLASWTIISERNMSQSPGITLSILLGSALTLELIYFLGKSSLKKLRIAKTATALTIKR